MEGLKLRIATLDLSNNMALAPMAGVTEWPMRLLCWEQGCAFAVTEMVSAKGFLHAPKDRPAVRDLLTVDPREGPVAVQLFGHEPDVCAEAARRLSDSGFCMIDLNMGCPAPKITRSGEGSALLNDPQRAAQIVRAVVAATHLPVSVKMRIGWDEKSLCAVPFARGMEEAGACALTVHGRTRMQFYAGKADWEQIAAVKAAVRIPVWGNGDVFCAGDARRMIEETGCDGVMVGRGAQGNPWIFAQILAERAGGQATLPTAAERCAMALRHARIQCEWKGEAVAMREMRKHVAWYLHGLHGASKVRDALQRMETYAQLQSLLEEMQQMQL